MNQEIHNFNKELVKLITNSIFKENITSIQELKDRAFQNEYNEEDVESIIRILIFDGILQQPENPFSKNDFMVHMHKIYEIEQENLI